MSKAAYQSQSVASKDAVAITTKDIYKYIDLDSSYRNRVNYPNPNNFVVPISYPGRDSTAATAIDPIIDAIPYGLEGGVTQVSNDTSHIKLDANESSINNYYVNSILQISPNGSGTEYSKIIAYDGSTKIATLETALSVASVPGDAYYIRKTLPFFTGSVSNTITPTMTTISLNSAASSIDNIYTNSYLRVTTGANTGLVSRISNYSGSNRKVTLFTRMPNNFSVGDQIELLSYTRDNATSLLASGSVGNGGQSSYYELELLWISVPLASLSVGYGGNILNYPYIYVQLYNEGKGQSNQSLISNNPNSASALFKVPIGQIDSTSNFLTLSGQGIKQVVQYTPDQDLRFAITLPNGNILTYVQNDNFSPLSPNPIIQVNAVFGMRKIN